MPFFKYKAYTKDGKIVSDKIEAIDYNQAYKNLKQKDLYPIEILLYEQLSFSKKKGDFIFALYQLSALVRSLSISEALQILKKQFKDTNLYDLFNYANKEIVAGKSLSQVFQEKRVDSIVVALVKTGEKIGKLSQMLKESADFLKWRKDFSGKIITVLSYPLFITIMSFIIILVIISFISPTLKEIFSAFNKPLPFTTNLIFITGNFIKHYYFLLILILLSLVFVYIKIIPKRFKDKLILSIPFYNKFYINITLALWFKTLHILLSAGISLDEALKLSSEIISNSIIKEKIEAISTEIIKGKNFSDELKKLSFIPDYIPSLVYTGQQSGQLTEFLQLVANSFFSQVQLTLNLLSKILEPLLIVFIGILLAFLLSSILLPIIDMTSFFKLKR